MAIYRGPNVNGGGKTFTVPVGDPLIFMTEDRLPSPLTLSIIPNGGSVVVNYRVGDDDIWFPITEGNLSGSVSSNSADIFYGAVSALRFTATTATATVGVSW